MEDKSLEVAKGQVKVVKIILLPYYFSFEWNSASKFTYYARYMNILQVVQLSSCSSSSSSELSPTFLFLIGGLNVSNEGAVGSACSLTMYLSLSSSLGML